MGSQHGIFNLPFLAGDFFRVTFMVLALVSCGAANAPAETPSATPLPQPGNSIATVPGNWHAERAARLLHWAKAAPEDALPVPDTRDLEAAMAKGDQNAVDTAASALALKLAHLHLLGSASPAARAGWRIVDNDDEIDLTSRLRQALTSGDLDGFFVRLAPQHPDYAALKAAYASEKDPARRKTIALNMERWRWMPQSLGPAYVLVNAAAFEASLWREGKRAGTWRVIVGKPSTPSPVFAARITGVTFNPWWDIPSSIVREKRGRFSASQGYVRSASGWRQKPGPKNSLGIVKLVMPNPYNVYLHDTPSKSLFAREVRAFSHGCIRVQEPLDLATALLNGSKDRAEVDAIVAGGRTTTVGLPASLPVYVTYFTAGVLGDGTFAVKPDIYGRDERVSAEFRPDITECSGAGG